MSVSQQTSAQRRLVHAGFHFWGGGGGGRGMPPWNLFAPLGNCIIKILLMLISA